MRKSIRRKNPKGKTGGESEMLYFQPANEKDRRIGDGLGLLLPDGTFEIFASDGESIVSRARKRTLGEWREIPIEGENKK